MIYYQFEDPDYGWLTYDLDGLMEQLKLSIENDGVIEGELTYTIRAVELSEEDYSKLPMIED